MHFLFSQVDLAHAITDTGLDLNQLAHLSQGNPLMLLALGAIAILGGKKGWEFWQKRQELKHEEKLEEIKASKELASSGHEQCVAKQETLETNMQSLKAKVVEVENKAVAAEKKAEEVITASKETLGNIEEGLKKVKKKVKKLEEIVEEETEQKPKKGKS